MKEMNSTVSYAEEILEEAAGPDVVEGEETTPLALGRTLRRDATSEQLTIHSPEGEVELKIRITKEGPVLSFELVNIALNNTGNVNIECEALNVKTRGASEFDIGGDLTHRIAGNYAMAARDDSNFSSQAVTVEAEFGDLTLKANDDLSLNGLRVLVNVPSDEELKVMKEKAKTIQDRLELPVEYDGAGRLPKTPPKQREDW